MNTLADKQVLQQTEQKRDMQRTHNHWEPMSAYVFTLWLAQCVVHALKGMACRARVTPARSPASHYKQCSALTSPALHARGCARPSRARRGHKNILFFQWVQNLGTQLNMPALWPALPQHPPHVWRVPSAHPGTSTCYPSHNWRCSERLQDT